MEAVEDYFGKDKVLTIATFGTIGTKNAIATTARGMGLSLDVTKYLTSLINSSRGFDDDLETTYKNSSAFRAEVDKYPEFYEIAKQLEGLTVNIGAHASGKYIMNDSYWNTGAMCYTPNGTRVTQMEYRTADLCGNLKYDFLSISGLSSIRESMDLLLQDKLIEDKGSLRETYQFYFGSKALDYSEEIFDKMSSGEIMNLFQFDTNVGKNAIKQAKPKNLVDVSTINAVMRLCPMEDGTMPLDKYSKFSDNIQLWYDEMKEYDLTEEEVKILEPYYLPYNGLPGMQENLMLLLQEPKISGFSLGDSNKARKIVGKKDIKKIPSLYEQYMNSGDGSQNLKQYVWDSCIKPQLSYAFSLPHTLSYSLVALVEANIYCHFPHEYWNTGVLRASIGSEGDTIDFGKMATAIANIQQHGIKIAKPNINNSDYGFTPDVKNHQINFGLGAIAGLGKDLLSKIMDNRPFSSFNDFLEKTTPTNTQGLTIIKSGAFDEFDEVHEILKRFEEYKIKKRKNITLTQTPLLKELKCIPVEYKKEVSLYDFTKYCKKELKKQDEYYILDERTLNYLSKFYPDYIQDNNKLNIKDWEKQYKKDIKPLQEFYKANKEELLHKVWIGELKQNYVKDGGLLSTSSYEMATLNCYISHHELSNVDYNFYNIVDFGSMPEEPKQTGNAKYAPYIINGFVGTVIRKEKTHSSITLLYPDGTTSNVQFTKSIFAQFEKEKTFERGNKLLIQGYRRGPRLIPKVYKDTILPICLKIDYVDSDGKLYFSK